MGEGHTRDQNNIKDSNTIPPGSTPPLGEKVKTQTKRKRLYEKRVR